LFQRERFGAYLSIQTKDFRGTGPVGDFLAKQFTQLFPPLGKAQPD
jgi:hypothetical protein